jgi:hypothetical protein
MESMNDNRLICPICLSKFLPNKVGRPRRYCSPACAQTQAYRNYDRRYRRNNAGLLDRNAKPVIQ